MTDVGNSDLSSHENLLELEQESQWRTLSVDVQEELDSSSSPPNRDDVAAGNEEDAVDDDVDDSPAADGFVATVNNEYVKGILQSADLYILQHGQVSAAYNRTGNSTGIEGVHDYCHLFRILCAPYYKVIGNDTTKDSLVDTPLALWVFMMGHQTSLYMQPKGGKWYFFLDNFYTRHTSRVATKVYRQQGSSYRYS